MSNLKNNKILFILTGSIAIYKIASVLSQLKKKKYHIKVVATPAALKFIGLSTLEGLTSEKVHIDLYENGSNMDHIHLVRWADQIVVAPATANFINKMASGVADDLASTLFLVHDFKKPFLIFPAMNTKMYQHPATQISIEKLRSWNLQVLDSGSGSLACGETGVGRLLEPEEIISAIEKNDQTFKGDNPALQKAGVTKKILISAGGTQEPIDDIRVITNKSTGRTAAAIADSLIENGFEITYLHSENAKLPLLDCPKINFTTFADLSSKLNLELKKDYTHFVHLAAVSDYSVAAFNGKINSDADYLDLRLKKNPKLIDQVKILNPKIKLIGFKLTSTTDQNYIDHKIKNLFDHAQCDYVVQNDWSSVNSPNHQFNFYKKNGVIAMNLTLVDLSQHLISEVLLQESL